MNQEAQYLPEYVVKVGVSYNPLFGHVGFVWGVQI